jgi:hypothetical protein
MWNGDPTDDALNSTNKKNDQCNEKNGPNYAAADIHLSLLTAYVASLGTYSVVISVRCRTDAHLRCAPRRSDPVSVRTIDEYCRETKANKSGAGRELDSLTADHPPQFH